MTATQEPLEITAGDTVIWSKTLSDYPASASWGLTYVFRSLTPGNVYTVNAAASGADHLVTITAAASAEYIAGDYQWQAYVTKAAERYTVGNGQLKIKPNLATTLGDLRSRYKRTLDAVEAVLEGRASNDQQEYTIQGRSLKKIPIADLIVLRDKYAALYQSELAAERIANGLGGKNKILVRL